MTLTELVRTSWAAHENEAREAFRVFQRLCEYPAPRIPGMDTVLRLAVRINQGASIEQAAAREYLYRMNLASDRWRAFPPPSLLGQ